MKTDSEEGNGKIHSEEIKEAKGGEGCVLSAVDLVAPAVR
jgi:hypothetical protein